MKLAFVLFHYFPYGGLERDMLALARICAGRQHEVKIYTQSWQGAKPEQIPVMELGVRALTNHGRALAFAKKLRAELEREPVDLVIGFNKMPGLDVYYAADVCFAQKAYEERGYWYRLSPRSRSYLALENAVFNASGKTHTLIISPAQIPVFQRYYRTPAQRLHLLPPGIRRDRIMPSDYCVQRAHLRDRFGLGADDRVLLMVGSDFRRKGVARSIRALAALPKLPCEATQLWVAGLDKPDAFQKLAQTLGVDQQVKFLGARDDVAQLMWSADIFLHPAHSEAAGAVLLEAMVAGLPVITTAVCGYAPYVAQQNMGVVLQSAEVDSALAPAITQVLAQDAQQWRERGRQFAEESDIFSMTERAADLIEHLGAAEIH
jgi:UDP-glucose:(heptosyl)LPS alpha-1,3-glucosyltransferase